MRPRALNWLENPNYDRARRSRKHEDRVAEELGGRRLRRSGGSHWSSSDKTTEDGDVGTPDFHVEAKRTDRKSIALKKEWFDKVKEGARKFGKDPAVVITFENPSKPSVPPDDWICIPLVVFKRLLPKRES